MKNQQIICLILFTLIIIHQTYADENLIQTTCNNTPNYQLCINTLRASPGSATADMAGLGLIMVAAVKAKSEQALSAVNSLRKSGQPKLSQPLQRCTDFYNGVLKADVPMAEEALRKGDPKFGEDGMVDAAFEAELCEGAFKGVVAPPPPLSGFNKDSTLNFN
ncbi:hypothetical protein ACS0TY_022521 [Phlomoides rotata]